MMWTLKLLFGLNKIFGLIGFTWQYGSSGAPRFIGNKIHAILAKFIACIVSVVYIFSTIISYVSDIENRVDTEVSYTSNIFDYIINFLLFFVIIISYSVNQRLLRSSFNTCVELSQLLIHPNVKFSTGALTAEMVYRSVTVIWNVQGSIELYDFKIEYIAWYLLDSITHCALLNLLVIFLIVRYFVRNLNAHLSDHVLKAKRGPNFRQQIALCDTLDQTQRIHVQISDLFASLTSSFSSILLTFVVFFFATIVFQVSLGP
jgi:hypothetical protein